MRLALWIIMRVLSNYSLISYLHSVFDAPLQLLSNRSSLATTPPTIIWGSCLDLDLGVDQADLLFPIECAQLDVPLDYTRGENNTKTEIQLLRVPATISPPRGSVIINPGGPGESGCDYLALRASRFHAYVVSLVANLADRSRILGGQFDLVSFDPRGTGNINPFSCAYRESPVSLSDAPSIHRRKVEEVLEEKWELYRTAAGDCFETELENGRFMSTAFLARDMLQIINVLGENLRYWGKCSHTTLIALTVAGSSYGTVLGMTFASMFPERVDRMMLDAAVNPREYMAGTNTEMLLDADKAYAAFLEECIAARDECVLADTAHDTADLSRVINQMLEGVLRDQGPQRYREIKNDIIYRGLYWPNTWASLAATILRFTEGDFSSLEANTGSTFEPFEYNKGAAAIFGTRCADASLRAESISELAQLLLQHQEISRFADVNMATTMICARWRIDAAERYLGNFTAATPNPILFVNGQHDPASPLASALNASTGFSGSRVLIHDSYGHGLSAHPNLCVGRAIRRYFVTGEVPATGFVCQREGGPFEMDIRAWQNNAELLEI